LAGAVGRAEMSINGASTSENPLGGGDSIIPKKESRKPKYTKFTQQELPACKPLLTPAWVIGTFMLVGVIFIPIGLVTLLASHSVVEIISQYETACLDQYIPGASKAQKVNYIQDINTAKSCNVTMNINKKMKQPVYIYYELDNFFQNHRRYVKSRSDEQLRGGKVSSSDLDLCAPEAQVNNLPIVPCGLIAWSLFNDTYTFVSRSNGPLTVNKKGIAWNSDVKYKFSSTLLPSNFPNNNVSGGSTIGGGSLDPSSPLALDEDLIVWMRTAALPSFRKLWGKIEIDLEAGDTITVDITNLYNTYSFGGKKKVVLSTTSWLGGKNDFLGFAYLTIGCLCMLLALLFFFVHWRNPRPLGDTSYLSWNKKGSASGENVLQ